LCDFIEYTIKVVPMGLYPHSGVTESRGVN